MAPSTGEQIAPLHGSLRAEELLRAALGGAGRSHFPDTSFLTALEYLIDACNREADLNAIGIRAVRIDILRCLMNVLRLEAIEARCPAVRSRPLRGPLFITGMPRSGTTFLHRLILQDPATAAPRLYQLVCPSSPRSSAGAALSKSWLGLQLLLFRMLAPELHALHPVSVDAPQDCRDIMAHVFTSSRFPSVYRVPSYKAWLQRTRLLDGYRFHRRFLQHLDRQEPGRRWVLKSPEHVFALDDLRQVYPDAHLVFVHRDPIRALASAARLTEVLRRPFAHSVDRVEIGRELSAAWIDGARRMCELAATGMPILHLHYRDIVREPLEAAQAIYDHCGMPLTAQAEERMWDWLRTSCPTGRRRDYNLAKYGLDSASLRVAFSRYTNIFGIRSDCDDAIRDGNVVVSLQSG